MPISFPFTLPEKVIQTLFQIASMFQASKGLYKLTIWGDYQQKLPLMKTPMHMGGMAYSFIVKLMLGLDQDLPNLHAKLKILQTLTQVSLLAVHSNEMSSF